MADKRLKRPRDFSQAAKLVVDIATGQVEDRPPTPEEHATRPLFEVCEQKVGGGYYVRATLPNSVPEQIRTFATEGEAARWIKNESVVWVHARRKVAN